VLYLKSVKKTSKTLQWADGIALVGGFIAFVYLLFGCCMNSVNRRHLIKQLIEDAYQVKKNRDYLEIGEKKYSKNCTYCCGGGIKPDQLQKRPPTSREEVYVEALDGELEPVVENENEEGGEIELNDFEGGAIRDNMSQRSGMSRGSRRIIDDKGSNKSRTSHKSAGGVSARSRQSQRTDQRLKMEKLKAA